MPNSDYQNYMERIGYHKILQNRVDEIYLPIGNYIYMYHTKTGIVLPNYPDNMTDSTSPSFQQSMPLGRSAPIYSYAGSGPRTISFQFQLHREMLEQVNHNNPSNLFPGEDYVDRLVKEIQAAALPNYAASEKMVDPPLVACRIGNEVYIKGVIQGAVTVSYSGPILSGKYDDKYALCNVGFAIAEVDPYDAQTVMKVGSFRVSGNDIPIGTTLDSSPSAFARPRSSAAGGAITSQSLR